MPIVQPDPAQFDPVFNGQFVHNQLEAPTPARAAILPFDISFYVQTAGLSPTLIAGLDAEARAIVPLFTGGLYTLSAFVDTGNAVAPLQPRAIVVELVNDLSTTWCGLTDEAALSGHVRLNVAVGLHTNGQACTRGLVDVFGHELGHALGFYHVAQTDCLMSINRPISHNGSLCGKERYHAGLAYQSQGAYQVRGSRIIIED